jgi:dienelactone hydrolase
MRSLRATGPAALLLLIALVPVPARAGGVPLPPDVAVTPPGPEVPEAFARFSGAWGRGAWGGVLPHVLVVERVTAGGEVMAVYAFGEAAEPQVPAGYVRVAGRIDEEGALVLPLARGRGVAEYRLAGDRLRGVYVAGGRRVTVVLEPVAPGGLAALSARPPAGPAPARLWVPMAQLGSHGGRRDVRLEVTVYRPAGPGPFPVLVFSHGAAGPAVPPKRTLRATALGRFFTERGYAVLAPMRRGRGASEGTDREGTRCDAAEARAGLARALEDTEAVVSFVRRQPWVDPERIVVAGTGRGGLVAVVYAAERAGSVAAVLNFAGGWWDERCDVRVGFTAAAFARAGRLTRAPSLWLYAERDSRYDAGAIREYHTAYTREGGEAALHLFPAFGADGHGLADRPEVWQPVVEPFLARLAPADR